MQIYSLVFAEMCKVQKLSKTFIFLLDSLQKHLLIASEGLTAIVVEFVKFRKVSERKQPKTQK